MSFGVERIRTTLQQRTLAAVANRRVFPYLVVITVVTAVLTGVIAHVVARKDFPTVGIGIWWSIVTLGTVGYGDVVPHTGWGRVLGSVVIVFGVTFIAFLIAIVTSLFVDSDRAGEKAASYARHQEVLWLLQELKTRMDVLEKRDAARPH